MSQWSDVRAGAPSLAAAAEARLRANRHHVIATLRVDGSPRVSGTEVDLGHGEIAVGMMPGSRKLADVRRDPRVEIHSAPLDENVVDGDVKLSGRLVEQGATTEPDGTMLQLDVARVAVVRVDGDELVITSWTPLGGVHEVRRH